MPVCPFWVVTSTNRKATSVIGFCRPVSTLASLIGVASGSVIEESFRWAIRSRVASPAAAAISGASLADRALVWPGAAVVVAVMRGSSRGVRQGREMIRAGVTPSTSRGVASALSLRSSGGSRASGTSW